jgi:hypothetical protein
MLKALVWKESRELAPLVGLALVAELLFYFPSSLLTMFYYNYSDYSSQIPFVSSTLPNWLLAVGAITGIALGFWQTSGELSRGTFLYLLHRPTEWRTISFVKLAVGTSLTLLVPGVPILAYAIWAAIPGNQPAPFFWSMTVGTWLIWFRLPFFYLGAYLSGLRPGRWLGSRAVPLFATPLLFAFLYVVAVWPVVSLCATLLIEAAYLYVILYVASTRDYS